MVFKNDRQRKAVMCKINLKHGTKLDSMFQRVQLAKGTTVEMEHTDDPAIAKAIAKAHLSESPKYYVYLEMMEKNMDKDIKILKDDKVIFLDLDGNMRKGIVTGFRVADDSYRTKIIDIRSDGVLFGAPKINVIRTM